MEVNMNSVTKYWKECTEFVRGSRRWIDQILALAEMAFHRRRLENELASILRTVSAHKKNGVPKGASQYQALNRAVNNQVIFFCQTYGIDPLEIEAQLPALGELKTLATPNKVWAPLVWIGLSATIGSIGVVILGFLVGVSYYLYTYGVHLAPHF
jgi:hypothetical protein